MKKGVTFAVFAAFICLSSIANAECSHDGFTVVYVNGIETTQEKALSDTNRLLKRVGDTFKSESVQAFSGYNQTHLAGLGDLLESVSQTFNAPISNYDRDTILNQIHSQLTTQKVLLVGHSQGSFYTNEIYKYLTANGIPTESIAVYNIASPASLTEGGGVHLTSANDKVINYIRKVDASVGAQLPLAANITLPLRAGEALPEPRFGQHAIERDLRAGDGAAQRTEKPGQPGGDVQRAFLRAFEDVVVVAALALDLR